MAKRQTVKTNPNPNAGKLDALDGPDDEETPAPRSSSRRVHSGEPCPKMDEEGKKCSGTLRTLTLRNVKRGMKTVQVPRLICDTCKARFGGE